MSKSRNAAIGADRPTGQKREDLVITRQTMASRRPGARAGDPEGHETWLLAAPRERPNVELVRWAISRQEAELRCPHTPLMQIPHVEPEMYVCGECMVQRITWRGLRLCRSCGHIGCCENSKQRHADRHFRMTGHPIVDALGPQGVWSFCYIDHIRFLA
jgi:ubiquitin-hydrolase Zn-finger-containing protein